MSHQETPFLADLSPSMRDSGQRSTAVAAERIVVFQIEERLVALPLEVVERVVPALAIEPLPRAPAIVLGLINVEGQITPVVDIKKRFSLPARDIQLDDHFILARTTQRPVALVVDAVIGVREKTEVTPAPTILPDLPWVAGVMKVAEGLILIHDLETFLSLEEAAALDRALASRP